MTQTGLTDYQVARLFQNMYGLVDLPTPEVVRKIRPEFDSDLETELSKARDSMIDVAEGIVIDTVTSDFQGLDYSRLETKKPRGVSVEVDTDKESDGVLINAELTGYFGRSGRKRHSEGDARRLEAMFGTPMDINFDHVPGLYIARNGQPKIIPLEQTEDSIRATGAGLKATHLVQLSYGALVPNNMLTAVYDLHTPKS